MVFAGERFANFCRQGHAIGNELIMSMKCFFPVLSWAKCSVSGNS
jgi:hypothetical protein